MDTRKSSASGGDDDLPLVSSMASAESKNICEVGVSSKRKKNKTVRTAHDEGDLDKILAELPVSPVSKVEKIQALSELVGPGEKDGEEQTVESSAAKKKRKKKDREKKLAASFLEAKEDKQDNPISEPSQSKKKVVNFKVAEKKVPKHVREKQEILARRKEAEERKKKEEEERLRKEEEERRIEEEREREAEEIRQKRKIRRMEKKQEGGILTAKQKREAAKNEAYKNKVLTDAGDVLFADKNDGSSKRPIYSNKNKSSCKKSNNSASVQMKGDVETKGNLTEEPGTLHELVSVEGKRVGIIESVDTEEKHEVVDVSKKNGDEEDVWDAKTNFTIEVDSDDKEEKPQPVVKKELKDTASKAHDSGPVPDIPTVKAGVVGKPKTAAKKAMPKVDDATRPKDTSKKGKGLVLNQLAKEGEENLRSPICCIMGHVDTGKTKLLDCIRGTNVQEGEAGGITQQIGATYFPAENIRERTKELNANAKLKVPGLLVIDTPGHESFTNLRSMGSNLCDLAILVVDIMHDLKPQTIESLNLLRRRNVKFIVALNKVDLLYGWKRITNAPIMKTMMQQTSDVVHEFKMRLNRVINQFQEQGLNSKLYSENIEMGETINIVPTSAISGEEIPDLLLLLVQWSQKTMVEKLTYVDKVQCTVLEVKVIEGQGITVDVVLVNGVLHEGDLIVVCGSQGPIVTTIRSLLTPHPMKEMRVKGTYLPQREVKGAQGIKIAAQGLEHAIAGTALRVIGPNEDLEEAKKKAMEDIKSVMNRIDKIDKGVHVQASTRGSLEALLEHLKSPGVNIPVIGTGIGPVHEGYHEGGCNAREEKELATILAFDVKVTAEVGKLADKMGVKIFCADTIYDLSKHFKSYIVAIKEEKKKETACEAVFPCVLQILPNRIYRQKDPIILGVEVKDGILKVGTPICILKMIEKVRVFMDIGHVASIKDLRDKPVDYAKKEQEVAIKIIASNPEEQKMFGRHFGIEDELVSHISKRSMDVLRTNYWDELSNNVKTLVLRLEKIFKI
ncbi:LOW QUALITY PROTEIN: eukaryotic translation initiation factor 5B [Capsella rubella]|uniref:LOW QUALITY PROTEIN: eukaryotic translation initiation factor 5B n=1 Tax=Capsella rubella TaxID=81985 RepID=UPI000CD56FAA|nr:LOW QUALITY PROTEIN: eukaryotic translation initiation factor 5B [Capsella rubella]